jgi:hypothetical protein
VEEACRAPSLERVALRGCCVTIGPADGGPDGGAGAGGGGGGGGSGGGGGGGQQADAFVAAGALAQALRDASVAGPRLSVEVTGPSPQPCLLPEAVL